MGINQGNHIYIYVVDKHVYCAIVFHFFLYQLGFKGQKRSYFILSSPPPLFKTKLRKLKDP